MRILGIFQCLFEQKGEWEKAHNIQIDDKDYLWNVGPEGKYVSDVVTDVVTHKVIIMQKILKKQIRCRADIAQQRREYLLHKRSLKYLFSLVARRC